MTERNPPETQEEFIARVAVEIEALNREILESGMSADDARLKHSLMSEKHQFEKEYNAVIPTLEEYQSIKAAIDYMPTETIIDQPVVKTVENTPILYTPVDGVVKTPIVDGSHVSTQVAPTNAIEAVSSPTQTKEATLVNNNGMLINRINMIDYVDRERHRAVRELEGKSRWGKVLPGLTKSVDELKTELSALATDESTLNSGELTLKRILESQIKQLVERETETKVSLNKADLEIHENIEIVVSDFKNLDKELQQAIRVGDEVVLDKYNVNKWAAKRIMRELSAREWQENQMKRKKAEGQITWKDIAGAVGTPDLALFSDEEISRVLQEREIEEATIGESLAKLQEQLKLVEAPSQMFDVPKEIPSPDSETVTQEVSDALKVSIKSGTWEEVDQLMSDPDAKISALAKIEWNRREKAALRESVEKKNRGALENTLEAIKSGHGDTVPEKWLNEFREVPRVAKFLKEQKPTPALEVPVLTEVISNETLPDVVLSKTGYLDKLERNVSRAQTELDTLNVPEILPPPAIADLSSHNTPSGDPAWKLEPLVPHNFNNVPPEVPDKKIKKGDPNDPSTWELLPIDHTSPTPESPVDIPLEVPITEKTPADVESEREQGKAKEEVSGVVNNAREHNEDVIFALERYKKITLEQITSRRGSGKELSYEVGFLLPLIAQTIKSFQEQPDLSQKEFDIKELEKNTDIPKVLSGFDAEAEIQKIMKAPSAERASLLASYKEKLTLQKNGLAKVQEEMMEDIRKNPEMTKEEFSKLYDERAELFGVTLEQKEIAEKIFAKYKEKHVAIERIRAEYPDDREMFKAAFGQAPKGEIEIIVGPISLYFRLHHIEDYALANSGKCQQVNVDIDANDIKKASSSGGMGRVPTLIPKLSGVVCIENTEGRKFEGLAVEIYEHEEQHVINEIVKRTREAEFPFSDNSLALAGDVGEIKELQSAMLTATPAEKKLFEARVVQLKRQIDILDTRRLKAIRERDASGRAKDEILAYTRDGKKLGEIYTLLTRKESEGGVYAYLKNTESLWSPAELYLKEENIPLVSELNDDFQVRKEEVFVKGYQAEIRTGLYAYQKLRNEGYKEEAIRSIFQDEPLSRWAKVTERLVGKVEKKTEIDPVVEEQFKEKFGMDRESLEKIPGFSELSAGQQLLTLRNLESIALTDVKKGATEAQKQEFKDMSWWERIRKNVLTFGMEADLRVAEIEKELAAKQRGGDADDLERTKTVAKNLASLEELTKVAKHGPEVKVNKDGTLRINYVSNKDIFDDDIESGLLTPENLAAKERFNAAADTYAKFPHEWGYETAKPGLLERFSQTRLEYTVARTEYDAARSNMLATYEAKFFGQKNSVQLAMLAMNKVDEQMQLNQLFNTHPDAEDALLKVEDQSVLRAAGKEFLKKKGTFMAYGMLARGAAVAISGGAMLPVIAVLSAAGASGIVGAGIGYAEGKKLMKEKRADGRMSEEDVREEIEYAVFKKDENGKEIIDEKTGEKVIESVETRTIREFTDANFFVKRIDRLVNKLEQSTNDSERELLEKKIAQTVALMKEKNERGMINFGGSSVDKKLERLDLQLSAATDITKKAELRKQMEELPAQKGKTIANRLNFIQAMSRGEIETSVDQKAVEEEMERITLLRQATIEDFRKEEIKKIARKAGLWRAGFALAGGAIAQGVRDFIDVGTPAEVPSATDSEVATPMAPTAVISETNVPTSTQETAVVIENEVADEGEESATATHVVKAGDNLTNIIKGHIGVMKDLTPAQQENAIQNLLSKLTASDMKAIGITDLNHLNPGQSIQIDKLNDFLGSEKLMNINGESLINHAQHLGTTDAASEVAQAEVVSGESSPPVSGFGEELEVVDTLSASDTAFIENSLGRSISATESNVLHSIKGLSLLADTDAAKNNINEAIVHLSQEMRTTNGIPLTTEQMMHILHQHNALDAQIRIPEVVPAVSVPPEAISSVTKAAAIESAPTAIVSPEVSIQSAHSVAEIAAYIKHTPTPDETFTLTNLLELEQGTKMNPGLSTDIAAAKIEIVNAMKLAKGELRPLAMYKILEAHQLESKVIVSPDAEGELLMYMETHKR